MLELWHYDESVIANLTKGEIVEAVNSVTKSPVFGNSADYKELLGEVIRDAEGRVLKAKAAR